MATKALKGIEYDQKRVREIKGSIEDIETIQSSQESSQGNMYSIEDAPQPCIAPVLTDDEDSLPMDFWIVLSLYLYKHVFL